MQFLPITKVNVNMSTRRWSDSYTLQLYTHTQTTILQLSELCPR